jgi:hypothetical protein
MTEELNQTTIPPVGDTGTVPGQQAGQTPAERMIAESQVNHIVAQRVKEAKEAERQAVASQYADYSQLKEIEKQWKSYQDSQKTDLQKAQDLLDTERNVWNTERTTLAELANKGKDALIELAFFKKATSKDIGLTPDRAEIAFRLLDKSQLKFNDKGEVENAADVVNALVEQYEVLKPTSTQPAVPPAKPGAKISPTNPSGTNTDPDMSWHPLMRNPEHRLGGGGYTLRSKGSK